VDEKKRWEKLGGEGAERIKGKQGGKVGKREQGRGGRVWGEMERYGVEEAIKVRVGGEGGRRGVKGGGSGRKWKGGKRSEREGYRCNFESWGCTHMPLGLAWSRDLHGPGVRGLGLTISAHAGV